MDAQLNLTFAALADPTRRAMLVRLTRGQANVSDLAKPFLSEMSPARSSTFKCFVMAGRLITKSKDAQWRRCQLNAEPFKEASHWMEQYRVYWEESFDRLEAYLKTVTAKNKPGEKSNGRKKK